MGVEEWMQGTWPGRLATWLCVGPNMTTPTRQRSLWRRAVSSRLLLRFRVTVAIALRDRDVRRGLL